MTGDELKALMEREKYTVKRLALALDISQRTLLRYRTQDEVPRRIILALRGLLEETRDVD